MSVATETKMDEWESEQQVCPCGDEQHAPPAVLDAIVAWNCHTGGFERKLKRLQYSSVGGYWFLISMGMHVGIERDGYIHS